MDEIVACQTWNIICVDPEHFQGDEWRQITDSSAFKANMVFLCIEEAHLMRDWSSFRPMFKSIRSFARGRLLAKMSVFFITATLQPGKHSHEVFDALGFTDGTYTLVRKSNERHNIQFNLHITKHGLNGHEFPDILPYVNSGQKTIIHCATMEIVYRVFVYLWTLEPDDVDHLRRIRMYHSLCGDEYNAKTIELLESDPHCQIVISTVAFANGINARSLRFSLSIGFPDSLDQAVQQMGRAGRIEEETAKAVIIVQENVISKAKKGTLYRHSSLDNT